MPAHTKNWAGRMPSLRRCVASAKNGLTWCGSCGGNPHSCFMAASWTALERTARGTSAFAHPIPAHLRLTEVFGGVVRSRRQTMPLFLGVKPRSNGDPTYVFSHELRGAPVASEPSFWAQSFRLLSSDPVPSNLLSIPPRARALMERVCGRANFPNDSSLSKLQAFASLSLPAVQRT